MPASMLIPWLVAAAALGVAGVLLVAWARSGRGANPVDLAPVLARIEGLERCGERTERSLRDEIALSRSDNAAALTAARNEQAESARGLRSDLLQQLALAGETQCAALAKATAAVADGLRSNEEKLALALERFEKASAGAQKATAEANARVVDEMARGQRERLDAFTLRLSELTNALDARFEALRRDNAEKLEQMRVTVDEKLQGTLEKRLGDSFRLVSERLEQVHAGLGDMQRLASGVGDLKRVLTNVSTRGSWGEMRLQSILEQILAPEQYEANVPCRVGSAERVEFAVRFPGRDGSGGSVYLPIDAKFPMEDYERLVAAEEAAEPAAVEAARAALERAVLLCARTICAKYIHPPRTTDFAVLFLPTEGLYAEVARRPALLERIQRECRVNVAGPTTLAAMLTSLQMGFRTLAIEQRSSEVWGVLGQVKSEFGKFGQVLDKVHKKLQEASHTVEDAQRRTRVMDRQLKTVEALPEGGALPNGGVGPLLEAEVMAMAESDPDHGH